MVQDLLERNKSCKFRLHRNVPNYLIYMHWICQIFFGFENPSSKFDGSIGSIEPIPTVPEVYYGN